MFIKGDRKTGDVLLNLDGYYIMDDGEYILPDRLHSVLQDFPIGDVADISPKKRTPVHDLNKKNPEFVQPVSLDPLVIHVMDLHNTYYTHPTIL